MWGITGSNHFGGFKTQNLIRYIKAGFNSVKREFAEHTKILFQVHDEIVFETPESNFKEVAIQIKNIMESIVKLNIPLISDINVWDNRLESFWRIKTRNLITRNLGNEIYLL